MMKSVILLIFENIFLIDVSSKLWDDLLCIKNLFFIIFLGFIFIVYRIFVVFLGKKEKRNC